MLHSFKNMFFPRDKEKIEEIPVEILHKAKPQRKKKKSNEKPPKKECLHTTESIISDKVKKYLYKLFGSSSFKAILENSITSGRSSSVYQERNEPKVTKFSEDVEDCSHPATKVNFLEGGLPKLNKKAWKYYGTPRNLSFSFRKSMVQRNLQITDVESLNNLYNLSSVATSSTTSYLKTPQKKIECPKDLGDKAAPTASPKTSKNVLDDLKSNSFCQIVDQLIKKQKKKPSRSRKSSTKKLRKVTKSSISTICERAKLLLRNSLGEEGTDPPDQSTFENQESEQKEEILTIHELNNYSTLKSSEGSIKISRNKSLESVDVYSRCSTKYKCTGKISSCLNLQHCSRLEYPSSFKDYEADLELWTTDYINGLVAVTEAPKCEVSPVSKIPLKKKCKSLKTKSKKYVKSDGSKQVKNDVRHLMGSGQNSLLGGVRTMERDPKYLRCNDPQKGRMDKGARCQKMQDIQHYIDNLMFPGDVPEKCPRYLRDLREATPKVKSLVPQGQSIQELKKFQRELKQRIKELEKKIPSTSSTMTKPKITNCASDHELSFVNMSHFYDEDLDNKRKLVKNVRYCTKKNKFNIKMKFGDKFCECCFLDAKKFPKDICRRCNKKVYLVERICAGDGVYHNFCYSCYSCRRSLNSLNLCVTRGEIFCKQCFQKYFGPEIYGFVN